MYCEKTSYSKNNINKALRFHSRRGKNFRAYLCPDCGQYHLTSQTKYTPSIDLKKRRDNAFR